MGTLSLILWPFDKTGNLQFWCARWWCRLIAWTIGARIEVHGIENLRPDQNYIYMANHTSLIDIPALFGYLPRRFYIMAKKELFSVPFLGWYLRTAGHFPVDRADPRRTMRSIKRIVEGVQAGKSLALFPEGTRSEDGRLKEFKQGAFKIALLAGVPVVPVAIRGTHERLPKGSLAPRPGRVDVILSAAIDPGKYQENLPGLIQRTREVIASNLN